MTVTLTTGMLAFVLLTFAAPAGATDPCVDVPTVSRWAGIYHAGLPARSAWLAEVRDCLASDPRAGPPLDDLAGQGLALAGQRLAASRGEALGLVRFSADLWWLLADADLPRAQYRLARLHRAPPGSLVFLAIRQDPAISGYWRARSLAKPDGPGLARPPALASWDHDGNVRAAVFAFYRLQLASGNVATWRWQTACYAAVIGLRRYSAEHERCVAFDMANTALAQGVHLLLGQRLPPQYDEAGHIQRVVDALLEAGLARDDAVALLFDIAARVVPATEEALDLLVRPAREPVY